MKRRASILLVFAAIPAIGTLAPRTSDDARAPATIAGSRHHYDRLSNGPALLPAPESDHILFGEGLLKESATPATELAPANACPPEMVEIDGDYCLYVYQRCLQFIDYEAKPPLMCQEFAASTGCYGSSTRLHFCIDRYEWPNRAGVLPAFSLTWYEARASCTAVGKRLCLDNEWTLACEGKEKLPYPYGFTRNDEACNIDKTYRTPNAQRYVDLPTRADELLRLDQREPSGSREACVSPFGVSDMAGNVDEWVVNYTGQYKPHQSGLKGGYWGPIRGRCRPMTTIHDEGFHYYQVGFRCCADASSPQ